MSQAFRPGVAPLIGTLALAFLTACASIPGVRGEDPALDGAAPGGHIITQDDILRSGANDAFEALVRGGSHLLIQDPGGGRAMRISHRGADSILLGNAILLVVDGSRVKSPESMLRSIPAPSVVFIQVLSGNEASVRWGSEAGNGVVLVRTSAR